MNRDLKPVTVLKKRLYLRRFLASFVNFYIKRLLRLFANYYLNFWMTASRLFTIETTFCECDKNHEFGNFKTMPCSTHKNLFFNEVAFYFVIIGLHKKCPHLSVFSLNVGECGPE